MSQTLPRAHRDRKNPSETCPLARASSWYDNVGELEGLPSQLASLATTVPQNMAPPRISSRHTPTQNSLRHSKIVTAGKGKKSMRSGTSRLRLGTCLSFWQLVFGLAVVGVAVWLTILTSSLKARDVPYWSGAVLAAAGLCGVILFGCCFRKATSGISHGPFVVTFKILGVLMSSAASILCLCAAVFAAWHLLQMSATKCASSSPNNATCDCIAGDNGNGVEEERESPALAYDVPCTTVLTSITFLLVASCVLNGIGGLFAAAYVVLYLLDPRDGFLYTGVLLRS